MIGKAKGPGRRAEIRYNFLLDHNTYTTNDTRKPTRISPTPPYIVLSLSNYSRFFRFPKDEKSLGPPTTTIIYCDR